jgi:hypothetical protein
VREPLIIKAISLVVGVILLVAGGVKLSVAEMMLDGFSDWGYTVTFMYVIGVVEVASAVMLLMARLRAYGATLISILMIGAIQPIP